MLGVIPFLAGVFIGLCALPLALVCLRPGLWRCECGHAREAHSGTGCTVCPCSLRPPAAAQPRGIGPDPARMQCGACGHPHRDGKTADDFACGVEGCACPVGRRFI